MSDALFQNAYYIGNNFNCILYGIQLVLYTQTMRRLFSMKGGRRSADRFFMLFSTVNLILITIFVAVQSVFGEEMWIVNADFPGGQGAYMQEYAAVWYQTMGTTASIALNLFSDGFLIYRCFVVWGDYRIVIFPCIMYTATFALAIVDIWSSGAPHGDYFAGLAVRLGIAYTATSMATNVLVTSLITGRILYIARASSKFFGIEIARSYAGVAAVIVESALLYTVTGIAFLVSYGMGSEISILFLSIYVMCTCVAPQLLVLRVVEGRAWKRSQFSESSPTLAFHSDKPGTPFGSSQGTRNETGIHVQLDIMRDPKVRLSVEDLAKYTSNV
ncbi:hypothetical protein BV25DRAFT_1825922 [Artomyces pyxidatus]|uniref:Uncharacterized protein n=1 Tax=Artomyces pyxidatus TaxID=48021 RepID=A0ACB8T0Q0_9AGAM|nr:hypothetical protein BV25DRAFT_1825922 [Artomyces pyxidatus]